MNKNAFTILDFLGYFFPGAILICAAYYLKLPGYEILSIKGETTSGLVYVICFILSYILGHLIALVSSVTIEKYANWKYGYPSHFLIDNYVRGKYFQIENMNNRDVSSYSPKGYRQQKIIVRSVMLLILFPISSLDFLLSKCIGIDYYYTRKLDYQVIQMVKCKIMMLFRKLNISGSETSILSCDFHRIIHNHYYEKNKEHSRRMDNCIAIYDFLRAIALIFSFLTFALIWRSFSSINFHNPIDWNLIFRIIMFATASYISYMGFLKFYRKFAVENLMCLICDDSLSLIQVPNSQEGHVSSSGTSERNQQSLTLIYER